jgi:hypothetical protein
MEDEMADLNQEYNTIQTQLNNVSNTLDTTSFTTPQDLLPVFNEEASIATEEIAFIQDVIAQFPDATYYSIAGAQDTYNAIEFYIADINSNNYPPGDTGTLVNTAQVYVSDLSIPPPPSPTLSITQADKTEAASIQLMENSAGSITSAPQTGTIDFTDTDPSTLPTGSTQSQTVMVTDAFGDNITSELTATQISALQSAFQITAAPGNTNNGAIDWTYNPQGTALDFLLEGETAVVTSTVQVADQDGNSDTATVAATLLGAPDNIYLNIILGSGGYGTITAFNNGQPLALSTTGSNQANVAYDDCMPVPAGTYTVLYRNSPSNGEVLEFSSANGASEFGDRSNIQIHIGNTPGDSAGCIVTGNTVVDGVATNSYWNGLLNVLNSIVNTENLSPNSGGYYTFQNPVTVTVSGNTAQPTLQIAPEFTNLVRGSSDSIDFEIAGLQPTTPVVDKNIDVYFQVIGATATQSLVSGATLLPNGSTSLGTTSSPPVLLPNGCFEADIIGSSQTSGGGDAGVAVTLNTAGVQSDSLSIQIVHYDGVSQETNLSTFNYDPPGQPMLEGSVPITINIVNPPPAPVDTTADMILSDLDGNYQIYDVGNNSILASSPLGQVGTEWAFAGLGDFNGTDTTDMLLRSSSTGAFEVYDISNNNITGAALLGQVGLEWQVAGFGGFSGNPNETDMMLRNANTGVFEVYDIQNNQITAASAIGQVGLEWQVAGSGDFSSNPNETDMVLRDTQTGAFEVYDISNSQLTSASALGQVGLEWQVAGFGDFSGNPNETDMMLHNVNTGVFELYDIQNNRITSASAIGQVGLEWQVTGFGRRTAPAPATWCCATPRPAPSRSTTSPTIS